MRSHAGLIFVFVLSGAVSVPVLHAQPDAKALLEQSVRNYNRDWRSGLAWAYLEKDISRSGGEENVSVIEVIPIAGTPYDRLIEKDGRKLTGDEARREQEKFEKTCRDRQKETAFERAARIHKYETQRAFVNEIPQAFEAKLVGEDVYDGRPAWILELTPRPDYRSTAAHASMLRHIGGKLWVDKQDLRWAKAEAHVIDTISFGWVLARVGPGANITFEQTRVADDFWMPKKISVQGLARILFVKDKELDETFTFSGFHQPQATVARR